MSLGYARDSIADLQSLHNLEKEDLDTNTAPSSYYLNGQGSKEQEAADDYYFNFEEDALFMEEQEDSSEIKAPVHLNVPLQQCNSKATKGDMNPVSVHHSDHPSGTTESSVSISTAAATPAATAASTAATNIFLGETTELLNDDSPQQTATSAFVSRKNRRGRSNAVTQEYANKQRTINYAYSGFDYSDYYQDSYMDEVMAMSSKKKKNILCCLFPFLQDPLLSDDEDDEGDSVTSEPVGCEDVNAKDNSPPNEVEKVNSLQELGDSSIVADSGRDSMGNHLEQEITREQLSISPSVSTSETDLSYSTTGDLCENQPFTRTGPISPEAQNPDTLNTHAAIETESDSTMSGQPTQPRKGILKHTIIKPQLPTRPEKSLHRSSAISKSPTDKNSPNARRRSILPTYESSSVHKSIALDESSAHTRSCKSVSFSSMARVVPVLPRSEMSYYLKSMIWWQRVDYEDFKKAGRIISKAMLQGGSEIWLQTSDAWGKKRDSRTDKNVGSASENNEEYRSALRQFGVNDQSEEKVTEDDSDDVGNKWWCRFGHSRRGLEHIVSVDEGRQRQKLVNASITAVLEEQRRQRLSRKDPNKIAAISMQYTSWARDLARAAGEADAEAVRSNFHSKAKGRLSYLSSRLLKRKDVNKVEGQPCASFILSANSALMAEVLDSHAHDATNVLLSSRTKGRVDTRSESKDDIAHKAAGFQFQQAAAAAAPA